MEFKLIFTILACFVLASCGGQNSAQTTQKNNQSEVSGYSIQLTDNWIKNAKVVDSNNQQAMYKGKGRYVFAKKPQGTITLSGGEFEKTNAPNKMTMQVAASARNLSPLDSFVHQYPHVKDTLFKSLENDPNALANTSKIVYLMASHNLLNDFSSSLKGVKTYRGVIHSARTIATQSGNRSINISLMLMSLSFFDVTNPNHIARIDGISPTLSSIVPANNSTIGTASNKRPTITLTFSENVDNVNTANVIFTKTGTATNLVSISTAASSSNYTLTLNTDLESNARYTLTLKSGIKDAVGNALSQVTKNYTAARFSGADTTAPTLSSTSPNSNTPIGSNSNKRPTITLNFSENIINVNANNVTFEQNGDPVGFSISGSGSSYTITPTRDLASDENYTLTLKSGITDAAGNALAQITKTYTVSALRRYVKTTSAGAGNGKSWLSAYGGANLQQAINDVAAAKGEVWIASGIYKPSSNNDASVSFELKDGVKIYGSFAGTETSPTTRNINANSTTFSGDIDGNDITNSAPNDGSYLGIKGINSKTVIKVINARDANTLIDGVYIVGGSSSGNSSAPESDRNGGGLFVKSSKLKLNNVYFRGNQSSEKGGAIYLTRGSNLNIDYTSGGPSGPGNPISYTFGKNKADEGGAICNNQSSLTLKSTATGKAVNIEDNKANKGGAIYSNQALSSTITNVNFKNNRAKKSGGALYNVSTNHTITNAAFLNNEALQSGGAIFNHASSNRLNGITFSGNRVQITPSQTSAPSTGGAIHNESNSNSSITNATFSYNTNYSNNDSYPDANGGAVYNKNSAPEFINTTFNHNHAHQGAAMYTQNTNTSQTKRPTFVNALIWDNTDGSSTYKQYYPQRNQTTASDAFASSASGTYMPTANSSTSDPNLFRPSTPTRVNGVKHEYYQIGASVSAGLNVGSHNINTGATVTVPNKDQIGNSRPRPNQTDCGSSSVCPGAVQVVDTNGSKVEYVFIKYFKKQSVSSPTARILVVFSEYMDGNSISTNNIEIEARDDTGNVTSVTPNLSRSGVGSGPTNKYQVEFTTQPNTRYTVKFKEPICNSGCGKTLNREYIYEYEPGTGGAL